MYDDAKCDMRAEREPEVYRELGRCRAANSELTAVIEALLDKVGPILRPSAPNIADSLTAEQEQGPITAIGECIRGISCDTYSSVYRLADALERIEL